MLDSLYDASGRVLPIRAPVGSRTRNLWLRRPALYPIELRAQGVHYEMQDGGRPGKRAQLYKIQNSLFEGNRTP
jgi:hypothetical protein